MALTPLRPPIMRSPPRTSSAGPAMAAEAEERRSPAMWAAVATTGPG